MKHSIIIAILLLSLVFRFTGINWDQNTHLHPDERFLTMVLMDLRIPDSIIEYLNPKTSKLNPTNVRDEAGAKKYSFFVYGSLPLTLTKLTALVSMNDTYNGITIVGRIISGFVDILTVLVIYKTIHLFEKFKNWDKSIKIWGAFLYSVAVLPIQLSHFFAVDTFLNTFIFFSFYFVLKFYFEKNYQNLLMSSVFIGFALASKITAIFFIPLLIAIITLKFIHMPDYRKTKIKIINKNNLLRFFISIILFFSASYFALRLTNPYMFENASLINPQINLDLIQSLKTLNSWNTKDVWYPPGVQWISKPPIVFALNNIALFGLGIPIFTFGIIGMINLLFNRKNLLIKVSIFWVLFVFTYQSSQFVKSIRYLIIIYPFLCIYAAYGLVTLHKSVPKYFRIITLTLILIWPLSFISIYLKPHSRVTASEWIYANIPAGSKIAWELWDDPLPLRLHGFSNERYEFIELKVFDYDTDEKIIDFIHSINKADFYILSSNRAWASLPSVPEKYPFMTNFYKELFGNKNRFIKAAEFTSYPSLRYLGIPIDFPDHSAEEAFTVYDHPKVLIYKKIN